MRMNSSVVWALWDNFCSEAKKLTPIFYYFFTKKAKMKINQNFYLASTFFVKNFYKRHTKINTYF